MNYYTRLRALWDEIDAIRPTQVFIFEHGSDTLNNMNQDGHKDFMIALLLCVLQYYSVMFYH